MLLRSFFIRTWNTLAGIRRHKQLLIRRLIQPEDLCNPISDGEIARRLGCGRFRYLQKSCCESQGSAGHSQLF